MKMSKSSLYDDSQTERATDPISQIFSRIRQHAERTKRTDYSWADLLDFLGTTFRVRLRLGPGAWACLPASLLAARFFADVPACLAPAWCVGDLWVERRPAKLGPSCGWWEGARR